MKSIFNGIEYEIPDEEVEAFQKWMDEEWKPAIEAGMITDGGLKRIPTNVRALSFTFMLKEKYEKEWAKYKI